MMNLLNCKNPINKKKMCKTLIIFSRYKYYDDHKLQVLEPHIESPLSPNLSSPSSASSSIASSPLFLPLDSPFLLPPLSCSSSHHLLEPPLLNLKKDSNYDTIFGPKRRRGRPRNTTQPAKQNDFTFIQPTVWDVNHQIQPKKASDIPKKKRGRKPKQQFTGNSCFVWKDLTSPRSPNKKHK
jgi:hypothetical protein